VPPDQSAEAIVNKAERRKWPISSGFRACWPCHLAIPGFSSKVESILVQ